MIKNSGNVYGGCCETLGCIGRKNRENHIKHCIDCQSKQKKK